MVDISSSEIQFEEMIGLNSQVVTYISMEGLYHSHLVLNVVKSILVFNCIAHFTVRCSQYEAHTFCFGDLGTDLWLMNVIISFQFFFFLPPFILLCPANHVKGAEDIHPQDSILTVSGSHFINLVCSLCKPGIGNTLYHLWQISVFKMQFISRPLVKEKLTSRY